MATRTGTVELDDIESWFVERGLPHFVERRESAAEIWGRAVPLLVVAYLVLGLNALDLAGWSAGRNVLAAAVVVAGLVVSWVVANRVRGRRAFARPERVGRAELAVFVLVPALPSLVLGQFGDAAAAVAEAIAVLFAVWALTSYGVGPLLRWAGHRAGAQLDTLVGVAVRALPLLLLFTTFLFINAEVWQVAGTLTGVPYVLVLVTFFLLGAVFVLTRVRPLMRRLATFTSWDDVAAGVGGTPAEPWFDLVRDDGEPPADRPSTRQRLNIGMVTIFSQAIQITLVAVVITAFFVAFGVLAIPASTTAAWTTLADVHVLASLDVDGRELVVTEPLLRVAGFLGAFTGMYFTVVLSTDATYRDEFAEDVAPDLRQALAVRTVYRAARAMDGGAPG